MSTERKNLIYSLLTGDDDGRICRDIPEEACDEQPGNLFKHIFSLAATKTGDGLADPKLVLSWLLNALGAPAFLIGFLVPIREAGALLPQLITSGSIRKISIKKWVWSAGSLIQGAAVIGMAASAYFYHGTMAGWIIIILLAIFAIARSVCSVSQKDVLGKTVSKSNRGVVAGTSVTIASILVLTFGIFLSLGTIDKTVQTISIAILFAGCLWLLAAWIFSTIAEKADSVASGNPLRLAFDHLALLKEDSQLVRFIITRGLLISTALAPPFLITLSGQASGKQFGQLGQFVIASGLAAILSSFIWGKLSDKSSRKVLSYSGLIAFAALLSAAAIGQYAAELIAGTLIIPFLHFLLMIAYQGVRIGRATHIVDMSKEGLRAAYTALSNTVIGIILITGGLFGFLIQSTGIKVVLLIFSIMALAASFSARTLAEVQNPD